MSSTRGWQLGMAQKADPENDRRRGTRTVPNHGDLQQKKKAKTKSKKKTDERGYESLIIGEGLRVCDLSKRKSRASLTVTALESNMATM